MKIFLIKTNRYVISLFIFIAFFIIFIVTFNRWKLSIKKNIEKELLNNNVCVEENKDNAELFLINQYKNNKLLALTFDDGPSKYTPYLLDELRKRNINVTFFILGSNAITRSDILKKEAENGNEIAIHSYIHKLFTRLKDEEILEQIDKTKIIIELNSNSTPVLIRVPYGSTNERIDKVLNTTQLTNVTWNVDSKDWKFRNTNKIYDYVLKKTKGNDIILMHDTYKPSVDAAIKLIDYYTKNCYTFVTVSTFLHIKELATK